MNIWRLITHHDDPDQALEWVRQNKRIAIGWGRIGDITKKGYVSAQDISAAIRREYPDLRNSGSGGPSLWNFYANMENHDLVILSTGKTRKLVEVLGNYEWTKGKLMLDGYVLSEDYNHQRCVQISKWSPDELWRKTGARPASGQNIRWTLIRCYRALNQRYR